MRAEFNVTAGAAVSTVNVTGELAPVSDAHVGLRRLGGVGAVFEGFDGPKGPGASHEERDFQFLDGRPLRARAAVYVERHYTAAFFR